MATIYDINSTELIVRASEELKKLMKKPEWSIFVKTGTAKERPPEDPEWWFKRSASILRTVYVKGPIGTNKLKVKYSSKKNRGYKPEKTYEASGKIIRTILQDLEKLGFVEQVEVKNHKGRKITSKGKSFLDKLAK
jgi:small subunit ribosomal protein S19e